MSTDNLDPNDILSLVEGECIGDRVSDAAIDEGEARVLRRRIRQNAGDRALYEDLRLSVSVLSHLPRLDAPEAVWQRIEARFEQTLAEGRIRTLPRGRRPRGTLVVLRRLAAAAACLLVVVMAGAWVLGIRGWRPATPGSDTEVTFVSARLQTPSVGVAIGEFLTKTTKRYQGVSPALAQRILGRPATGE